MNIGVALFCPERRTVRVRFAESLQVRIRKVFDQRDRTLLENQIGAVRYRIEQGAAEFRGREDFELYAATRANSVVLTPPRFVKVRDADEAIDSLFERLIGLT